MAATAADGGGAVIAAGAKEFAGDSSMRAPST